MHCSIKRSVRKLKVSPLATAGKGADTKIPSQGATTGPGIKDREKEQDPFLSLSGDEFDTSLLDGINEPESFKPASSGQSPESGYCNTRVNPYDE